MYQTQLSSCCICLSKCPLFFKKTSNGVLLYSYMHKHSLYMTVYSRLGTLCPHNCMCHGKASVNGYLRCCPLHRYFPSTRNIIYIISNIPSHSKISNLLNQSYHMLHIFTVYFTLHTSSLDTSIFLAARSLCTKPLDAR